MPFSKTGPPFYFSNIARNKKTTEGSLIRDHVYVFRAGNSTKYRVNLHEYIFGVYAVKFNLTKKSNDKDRYTALANHPEKFRVLKTIVAIMVDQVKYDPKASFAFIGMPLDKEKQDSTKRFRVYKILSQRFFDHAKFEHGEDANRSLYLILNKVNNIEHQRKKLLECLTTELVEEILPNTANPFGRSTGRS